MPNDRIVFGAYTWNFVSLSGNPQIPQRVLKTLQMPGVDGKAFKIMRREGSKATIQFTAVAVNLADEIAWIASMAELSGRQVQIYSSTGVSYGNQVLHEVQHVSSQKIAVGAWGATALGSDARLLTFQATTEYPYGS